MIEITVALGDAQRATGEIRASVEVVFTRLNALEDGAGSGGVPPILVDVATEDEIIDLAFRNA